MKHLLLLFSFMILGLMINAQVTGTMAWIPLTPGTANGACSSNSDCDTDILCFGLQYTPGATGIVTDYTTGFITNCLAVGNAVTTNASCVMGDNSGFLDACPAGVLFNSSGNTGSTSYTMGVPVIIHQVCFTIAPGEVLNIVEDATTNLTTNIDLPGGTSVTDEPTFITFDLIRDSECPAIGLPVELVSFTAHKEGDVNVLNWTSASEENTDKFIIQRSENNFDTYEDIASVRAAGYSTERIDYFSVDEKPLATSYYRLKMIDLDGTYEYSDVVVLKRDDKTLHFNSISPSPTRGEFNISFEAVSNDDITFTISDLAGNIVYRQIASPRDNTTLEFDMKDLPDGVYIITMNNGFEKKSEKIVLHK